MRLKELPAAIFALALASASQAAVVYDNLGDPNVVPPVPPLPVGSITGTVLSNGIAADEITLLTPGPRIFETAQIAYGASNFSGNETLTLTLRRMDGAPTPGSFGFNTPGTTLFTQTVAIAGGGSVATFSDASGTVILPDQLAAMLEFGGIETGEDYTIPLFDPPVVGSSFRDFWVVDFPTSGDPWSLYVALLIPGFDAARTGGAGDTNPVNFGIRITAVEHTAASEPATLALLGLGLAGLGLMRRRRAG